MLEMLAYTQRTDNFPRFVLQLLYRPIVQMVPMVVRNDEIVYLRYVVRLLEVCSLKRLVDEGYG